MANDYSASTAVCVIVSEVQHYAWFRRVLESFCGFFFSNLQINIGTLTLPSGKMFHPGQFVLVTE